MSLQKIILMALLPVALTGCNDALNTVKNARMKVNEKYTVAEAFGNRDICSSVDWDVIKDDRGREIVQYKCHLTDISSYYDMEKKRQREHLLSIFDTERRVAQVPLEPARLELESAEQAAISPTPANNAAPESELLVQLNELNVILSDASLKQALQLRNRYSLPIGPELIDLSRRYFDQDLWINANGAQNASPERLAAYKQAENELRQAMQVNQDKVLTAIEQERARLNGVQQSRRGESATYAQQRAIKARDAYEKLQSSVESQLAELDANQVSRLKQFDNAAAVVSVAEVFQWIVKGDQIDVIWSGLEGTYSDGQVKTSKHSDLGESLRDIYGNTPKSYSEMRDKAALM
ncbi:hypothetical protein JOE33_003675 [Pseudomonas sp. PvP027]|uniref:hypothetical protein n=1 Tax=Pseudomonas sp. PvP027 TaxID=2806587 RepID=UPI001AE3D483|nr:hypothetical protein [Pseudomonas sp. PvP027]MBP1146752.1 hypothetical protein [Pseudomonas sp. PvP027]